MTEASLEQFARQVGATSRLRVEKDYGDGFVRLQTSEAERRQAAQDIQSSENIILELLRNSRDAHAKNLFVAMSKEGRKRTLTVIDDGDGIPEAMHSLVFEPRVTSKLDSAHMDAWGLHGRGMALYSIAVNAQSAKVVSSAETLGCAISVQTDTGSLPERADQSTFPNFELTNAGVVNVRGPKNILRTVCEFALESRAHCTVFIGSPAEICATLHAYGVSTLSTIDRLFCRDHRALPLVKRLATCSDPAGFTALALSQLGLSISERTARRILDGQIPEVDPVLDRIKIAGRGNGSARKKGRGHAGDARGLKLQPQDRALLARSVMNGYSELAEKYYLEPEVDPTVVVRNDKITVSIPVVKQP